MPYQDSDVTGGKVRLKTSMTAGETLAASGLVPGELALNAAVSLRLGTQGVTGYLGSQLVTATVPGAPTIVSAEYDGANTEVNADAFELNDGGSPITGFKWYFDGDEYIPDQYSPGPPFEVGVFSTNFAGQGAQVSAVNAVGEGPKSAAVTVADNS